MATEETWHKCRHFSPKSKHDKWGDPYALNDDLILTLDDFRRYINTPIYVTCGTQGRHAANSWHYIKNGARAVDIVIPGWEDSIIDLMFAVFRFPFSGVGYYPHWKYGGKKVHGFHLDNRPLKWESDFTKNYQNSRWMGVKNKKGKQVYRALTLDNLVRYLGGSDGMVDGHMGLS